MAKKLTREKRVEKELLWIIGFLAFLVILFFAASAVFRKLNSFEYEGLTFTKERFDKLIVYHHYYYFTNEQGEVIRYDLFIRTDPRNNSVPFEGETIYFDSKSVYITILADALLECPDSIVSIGDLTSFVRAHGFNVAAGNMNKTEAKLQDQRYMTCERKPEAEVIQIFGTGTNETKVSVYGNCTSISVGKTCDILDAVEKFKVRAVADWKKSLNPS